MAAISIFQPLPIYLYQRQEELPRPADPFCDYILAEQGIIKRLETWHTSVDAVVVPVPPDKLAGLHLMEYPLKPLEFKLPRIPRKLLDDVLDNARQNPELEHMYHYQFHPQHGWYVTIPTYFNQTWDNVGYGYDQTQAGRLRIAVDLHSHNTMDAFFSPTDDNDERGDRYYAVIGQVDQPNPRIVVRLGLYGSGWLHNIPASLLFEDIGAFQEKWIHTHSFGEAAYLYEAESSPGPSANAGALAWSPSDLRRYLNL